MKVCEINFIEFQNERCKYTKKSILESVCCHNNNITMVLLMWQTEVVIR